MTDLVPVEPVPSSKKEAIVNATYYVHELAEGMRAVDGERIRTIARVSAPDKHSLQPAAWWVYFEDGGYRMYSGGDLMVVQE